MSPTKDPNSHGQGAATGFAKKGASEETTKLSATSVVSEANGSPLRYTPMAEIAPGVDRLRDAFHRTQKTHSLQFRLNQLRNLYFAIKDQREAICEALFKDFHRAHAETKNLELVGGLNELVHTMANLHKWMQPDSIEGLPLLMASTPAYIEKIPLGVVLIISPFNYPFFLTLSALVGALSAGNVIVLKQSELTPHFLQLFSEILTKALDPDTFYAVNGAVEETTELLNQKFDKIMYTGNNTVGTIVAKKAAETLTPVILELGGKLPAFVLEDCSLADLVTISNRIVWGRFTNAGQTCVAVDYVLVHESKRQELEKCLKYAVEQKFYPGLTKSDPNYTHVIHDRAYQNLCKILDSSKGKFLTGNQRDAESRFIAPTIVTGVDFSDSTMQGELFGPILPVITYTDLHDAVRDVTKHHDTPLAQYIFTSNPLRTANKEIDLILKTVRSGGLMINDVLLHVALANAPFGGIGNSGHGAYHGEYSFRAFSHERSTLEIALWKETALAARYPPFTKAKVDLVESSLTGYGNKVWFGRTGDVKLNGPNPLWSFYSGVAGVFALACYFYAAL